MKYILTLLTILLIYPFSYGQNDFITTWQTTSSNEMITIPTTGGGYNYNVDWGDGSSIQTFTGDASHTYTTAGNQVIKIDGGGSNFPRIYFNDTGDKDKIISIDQWGEQEWTSMENAFKGCSNLNIVASDTPELSGLGNLRAMFFNCTSLDADINDWNVDGITNMRDLFFGCSSFNSELNNWNVSSATTMRAMFMNASSFDQDLSSWDISNVSNMLDMFRNITLSTANYDALLIAWDAQTLQFGVNFHGGNSTYCDGIFARTNMTENDGWTITDGGEDANCPADLDAFITTWETSSSNESITIPTSGGGYNYKVNWGDGTAHQNQTGNATHTYTDAGQYQVYITGDFPIIYFNNSGDKDKIISIDQWGNQVWTTMFKAFHGCSNLGGQASDNPDLSNVTSMYRMFYNATSFDQDISNWDVSNVISISHMFENASSFNQDIGNWNVANVTNMSFMFSHATSFDQDIGNWNVANVTNMSNMFRDAISFNQNIGNWNVANVTDMLSMFSHATSFNQDIDNWNVANVTDIRSMFSHATSFNQNIGNWNVANVTDMWSMFSHATSFDQDIGNWNVANVTNMRFMFSHATSFNQNIGNWNVANVTDIRFMFSHATSFDQDLGNWDVSSVGIMYFMFDGVSLSTSNYDALLGGWASQSLQLGVNFHAGNSQYCYNEIWKQKMIDDLGWTIIDNGKDATCDIDDFITTWETTSPNESITIPTTSGVYNYTVHWGDGSADNNLTGDASHTYTSVGQYQVNITGDFPRIYFTNAGDKDKIISIDQWGDQQWTSMKNAFWGCSNLAGQASDEPDLSSVTNMSSIFRNCSSFNQDINSWDVSNVSSMQFCFLGCSSFNQNIGGWAVSNTSNMRGLFSGASLFDQNLSSWDVSNVDDMLDMFHNVTLSTTNYDALLIGWDALSLEPNVNFQGGNSQYCDGAGARQHIIDNDGWTITDSGENPSCGPTLDDFITTWETTSSNESITIPTTNSGYNYTVHWGDGYTDYNQTGDAIHTYAVAGQYQVYITGDFPRVYFNNTGDKDKIISINQWGIQQWSALHNAFMGCSNLAGQATDNPDLSSVTHLNGMFVYATSFNQNIGSWDVSNVTNMLDMFKNASSFNQDISAWEVSNVIHIAGMFEGATSFNQDIGSWNMSNTTATSRLFKGASSFNQDIGGWILSNVTSMYSMFENATSFNQDIGDWDVSSVTGTISVNSGMYSMFEGATSFNQDIGDWDVSNVTKMGFMFRDASSFNQDIGDWDVANVSHMGFIFDGAISFNQDIGDWDVSNLSSMHALFRNASSFNGDIGGWNVSNVSYMGSLFRNATSFNQDIGGWDVSNVTSFQRTFEGTTSFDQDIGNWDVSSVTNMYFMFEGATLSTPNYDALLIGWNDLNLQPNLSFHGGNSQYCAGECARANMINNDNWNINDGEIESSCNSSLLVTSTDNNGMGSLRNAFSCSVSHDTIIISSSLALDTMILTSTPITIDHDMTIIGSSSLDYFIYGSDQNNTFIIDNGVSATLENLNFVQGDNLVENIILNNGNLTLKAITMDKNNQINANTINNTGQLMILDSLNILK